MAQCVKSLLSSVRTWAQILRSQQVFCHRAPKPRSEVEAGRTSKASRLWAHLDYTAANNPKTLSQSGGWGPTFTAVLWHLHVNCGIGLYAHTHMHEQRRYFNTIDNIFNDQKFIFFICMNILFLAYLTPFYSMWLFRDVAGLTLFSESSEK